MGKDPERDPPFFFTKWAETLMPTGSTINYPPETNNFHYEGELVVAIGKPGRGLRAEEALDHVYGYAVGIDLTRRDLQFAARDKGRPWDTGKNFEQASPLGLIHPVSEVGHINHGAITLQVNGETRQSADIADLIWPVTDILRFLSKFYRLEPGDLIYTGTPAGVGPISPGDEVVASVEGLQSVVIRVGPKADD
jgi:fumarylpyruvate hydrolase